MHRVVGVIILAAIIFAFYNYDKRRSDPEENVSEELGGEHDPAQTQTKTRESWKGFFIWKSSPEPVPTITTTEEHELRRVQTTAPDRGFLYPMEGPNAPPPYAGADLDVKEVSLSRKG
ncbi:hypothetical protein C0991_004987 [Blastosporella zonata]|nr:hypothetical protein C0991_004987 [Blastosporella zonata]